MAELPESYELTFDPQRIDAVAAHAFLMAVVVVFVELYKEIIHGVYYTLSS